MTTELATITNDTAPSQQDGPHGALVVRDAQSLDRNPAAVYLIELQGMGHLIQL